MPFLNNSATAAQHGDITPAFTDGACRQRRQRHDQRPGDEQCGRQPVSSASTWPAPAAVYERDHQAAPPQLLLHQVPVPAPRTSSPSRTPGTSPRCVDGVPVTSGNTTTKLVLNPQIASPPAVVQDVGSGSQAAVTSFTVPTAATAGGDLLAISTEFDGGSGNASGSVTGVTDSAGDTWTKAIAADATTRIGAEVWYAPAATAGVTSVTVSYSTSVNPVVRFYEISNASVARRGSLPLLAPARVRAVARPRARRPARTRWSSGTSGLSPPPRTIGRLSLGIHGRRPARNPAIELPELGAGWPRGRLVDRRVLVLGSADTLKARRARSPGPRWSPHSCRRRRAMKVLLTGTARCGSTWAANVLGRADGARRCSNRTGLLRTCSAPWWRAPRIASRAAAGAAQLLVPAALGPGVRRRLADGTRRGRARCRPARVADAAGSSRRAGRDAGDGNEPRCASVPATSSSSR